MIYLYNLIFYQPILNALIFFYNTIAFRDLGLAIIFSTVLVRLILFPVFQRSARNQAIMQRLQPKLKKIKEEHKKDWEKQSQAMMAVYKEHKINPFSGFLLLLIQLPILIALYQIFLRIFSPEIFSGLYFFIAKPGILNTTLAGLINLGEKSILMVVLAAAAQYFQGKLSMPPKSNQGDLSPQERMARQMIFIGPIITLAVFYNLPAAIGLYWLTTSAFSIFQQTVINRELANGEPGNVHKKTA